MEVVYSIDNMGVIVDNSSMYNQAAVTLVQWLSTMFVHFWKQAPNLAHW